MKINNSNKNFVTIGLLTLLTTQVQASSYKSIANTMRIHDDNNVSLSLYTIADEDADKRCLKEGEFITFTLDGGGASSAWLDSIVLARQSNQALEFEYDETDCSLVSLMYPEIIGSNGGSGSGGPLLETGLNGNVALLGTNNIFADKITASQHYRNDVPAAAFDGYTYLSQTNEDSEEKIERGMWLAKLRDVNGNRINSWIDIDYSIPVDIRAIGIFINQTSLELGRLPSKLVIHVSEDGEDYEDIYEVVLKRQEENIIELPEKLLSRFFRLEFGGNFGDKTFIEVDEIEFYQ